MPHFEPERILDKEKRWTDYAVQHEDGASPTQCGQGSNSQLLPQTTVLLVLCLALLYSLTGYLPFQSSGPHRDFWPHFLVTCCVCLVEIWDIVLLPHRISKRPQKHLPKGTHICISSVRPTHLPINSPFPEHRTRNLPLSNVIKQFPALIQCLLQVQWWRLFFGLHWEWPAWKMTVGETIWSFFKKEMLLSHTPLWPCDLFYSWADVLSPEMKSLSLN